MTYKLLFEAVQSQSVPIRTGWLRKKVTELSAIKKIHEHWSGVLDGEFLRGFYIEGPMNGPKAVGENEALIVLSRNMCNGPVGQHWRRFILTKELMHAFDTEGEKTNTPEKLDGQVRRFRNPGEGSSPQFEAEVKALWRAHGVLCTQAQRSEYRAQLIAGTISFEVVAAALRLPVNAVRQMMSNDFEKSLAASMD